MTDNDHANGWTEYRLLVTSVLERHDLAIEALETLYHDLKNDISERRSILRTELREHVDSKFVQLGEMHRSQVNNAKRDLVDEVKKTQDESVQVKIASVTSSWQFWGVVIVQIGTLAAALMALLS